MGEESSREAYWRMQELSWAEDPPRFIRAADTDVYPVWQGHRVELHFTMEGLARMVPLFLGRHGMLLLPDGETEVRYDLRKSADRFVEISQRPIPTQSLE